MPGLLPDLRWICHGRYSFQAIYLSFTTDSWTCHQERDKWGRHMSPVGAIGFKGFNGEKIAISLTAFKCDSGLKRNLRKQTPGASWPSNKNKS